MKIQRTFYIQEKDFIILKSLAINLRRRTGDLIVEGISDLIEKYKKPDENDKRGQQSVGLIIQS